MNNCVIRENNRFISIVSAVEPINNDRVRPGQSGSERVIGVTIAIGCHRSD